MCVRGMYLPLYMCVTYLPLKEADAHTTNTHIKRQMPHMCVSGMDLPPNTHIKRQIHTCLTHIYMCVRGVYLPLYMCVRGMEEADHTTYTHIKRQIHTPNTHIKRQICPLYVC